MKKKHGMTGDQKDKLQCPNFSAKFNRKYNLVQHMKKMHGEKPKFEVGRPFNFVCDVNNKCFQVWKMSMYIYIKIIARSTFENTCSL